MHARTYTHGMQREMWEDTDLWTQELVTVATYPVLRAVRPAIASVPILASIQGVPESVDSHACHARNPVNGRASTIAAESCA